MCARRVLCVFLGVVCVHTRMPHTCTHMHHIYICIRKEREHTQARGAHARARTHTHTHTHTFTHTHTPYMHLVCVREFEDFEHALRNDTAGEKSQKSVSKYSRPRKFLYTDFPVFVPAAIMAKQYCFPPVFVQYTVLPLPQWQYSILRFQGRISQKTTFQNLCLLPRWQYSTTDGLFLRSLCLVFIFFFSFYFRFAYIMAFNTAPLAASS